MKEYGFLGNIKVYFYKKERILGWRKKGKIDVYCKKCRWKNGNIKKKGL